MIMDDVDKLNILAFSFIGDAVHTLFVRNKITSANNYKVGKLTSLASQFCKAEYQEKVYFLIEPKLLPEELAIAKRARNANIQHAAKNCSIETYRHATAFEAVVGFLFLKDNKNRLDLILNLSMKGTDYEN